MATVLDPGTRSVLPLVPGAEARSPLHGIKTGLGMVSDQSCQTFLTRVPQERGTVDLVRTRSPQGRRVPNVMQPRSGDQDWPIDRVQRVGNPPGASGDPSRVRPPFRPLARQVGTRDLAGAFRIPGCHRATSRLSVNAAQRPHRDGPLQPRPGGVAILSRQSQLRSREVAPRRHHSDPFGGGRLPRARRADKLLCLAAELRQIRLVREGSHSCLLGYPATRRQEPGGSNGDELRSSGGGLGPFRGSGGAHLRRGDRTPERPADPKPWSGSEIPRRTAPTVWILERVASKR